MLLFNKVDEEKTFFNIRCADAIRANCGKWNDDNATILIVHNIPSLSIFVCTGLGANKDFSTPFEILAILPFCWLELHKSLYLYVRCKMEENEKQWHPLNLEGQLQLYVQLHNQQTSIFIEFFR